MKPLSRAQKIDLLNGIQKGVRSIVELIPVTHEVWRQINDEGSYFQKATGITLTAEEFEKYKKSIPKNVLIVKITRGPRGIPLAFRECDVQLD